mgnify:CR=1 FL=1
MPYGLQESELQKLHELFRANGNIRQVILYGSRAKGNYKPFSDVDITLTGEHLTRTDVNRLQAALAESSLPYQFDISLFASLKSDELVDHIRRRGIVIYQK